MCALFVSHRYDIMLTLYSRLPERIDRMQTIMMTLDNRLQMHTKDVP